MISTLEDKFIVLSLVCGFFFSLTFYEEQNISIKTIATRFHS